MVYAPLRRSPCFVSIGVGTAERRADGAYAWRIRATSDRCYPRPTMNNGDLATRHRHLAERRAFLIAGAGGIGALFAAPPAAAIPRVANPWPVLAAVQDHLFPSELDAPGAREIRALAYLQGVLADPAGDREEQGFILKGVDWLEGLCRQRHQASFIDLDALRREQVLRAVAGTRKGENWLATLLLYLCEALLADPAYGGNPDGVGWTWLRHQPGHPRPTPDKLRGAGR